jgi:hypothetical protein
MALHATRFRKPAAQLEVEAVYANRDDELSAIERDRAVERALANHLDPAVTCARTPE